MNQRIPTKILVAGFALVLLAAPGLGGSSDASPAANKTVAGDGSFAYLGTAASPLPPTTILSTGIKTGGQQDLLIQVAMECSLVTDVYSTTIQDHPEGYTAIGEAAAAVVAWVEVDGAPIVVGDSDEFITFCDRLHRQEIQDIDDDTGNFTIRQLQETMTANSFNWVALDLSPGWHTIEVLATITAQNTEGSFAEGAIQQRTVVVEPVHFANGATVSTDQGTASAEAASADATYGDSADSEGNSFVEWLQSWI